MSEDGNATNSETITGWTTVSGTMGINPVTTRDPVTDEITGLSYPFYDNGLIPDNNGQIPDGTNVGFIRIQRVLEQQINGLKAGQEYQVSFSYNARALYRVDRGEVGNEDVQFLRLIMTEDDTNFLHTNTNVMSNGRLGATVIYNDREIFYDVGVHLRASGFGRTGPRAGLNIRFPAM